MKYKINIRGVLVPNEYKWFYDWFGEDCTCPSDVQKIINQLQTGDEIEVYINSPGGVIEVGSEIYTLLRIHSDIVKIYITGEACSAASIVAMASYCEMAPTALMMVHCVSTRAEGNHNNLEHTAEVLRTADRALCMAYVAKSKMTEEEVTLMMEKETWLTATQAKELGLIDGIMFEKTEKPLCLAAGPLFALPSKESMEKVKLLIKEEESRENKDSAFLLQIKWNLLQLKGERR